MSNVKGILLIMLAATCFGVIPLFTTIAYTNGFNPFTFSLFRSAFATIEIFLFIKVKGIDYSIERKQCTTLFKASLIGYSFMMVTLFMSFNYVSTGLAMALHFVYPVATMLGAIIVFKEKVVLGKIVSLIVSLLGIYFLVGFGTLITFNIIGIILALVSGLLYAYYVLIAAYGNINKLNPFVLTLYVSLFNSIILLFASLITGNLFLKFTLNGLLSTILVALFANLIGMAAFQTGLKVVGPTTATVLSTFEPITSLIVGILVLGEKLEWSHITGSMLIIGSVIIIAFATKNSMDKIRWWHDADY